MDAFQDPRDLDNGIPSLTNNQWEDEELRLNLDNGKVVTLRNPTELAIYVTADPENAESIYNWISSLLLKLHNIPSHKNRGYHSNPSADHIVPDEEMRVDHPPKFNGDRNDWPHFKVNLHLKMSVDGHHYPTAFDRMLYVMSLCEDRALGHLTQYFEEDGSIVVPGKPQADWRDLVKILDLVFGDPTTPLPSH
ncbi:hypothetical protein HDK64DRAFT_253275 [Phyllosticta capitalensis]